MLTDPKADIEYLQERLASAAQIPRKYLFSSSPCHAMVVYDEEFAVQQLESLMRVAQVPPRKDANPCGEIKLGPFEQFIKS